MVVGLVEYITYSKDPILRHTTSPRQEQETTPLPRIPRGEEPANGRGRGHDPARNPAAQPRSFSDVVRQAP